VKARAREKTAQTAIPAVGAINNPSDMRAIVSHRDLKVFVNAMDAAIAIHLLVKLFPKEERWLLADQLLRSSRSVCANIAEAWRKRRYVASFVSKLAEIQGEAAETQVWLEFAYRVQYIPEAMFTELYKRYDVILAQLTIMTRYAHKWTRSGRRDDETA
jgi:four helix bundle protein